MDDPFTPLHFAVSDDRQQEHGCSCARAMRSDPSPSELFCLRVVCDTNSARIGAREGEERREGGMLLSLPDISADSSQSKCRLE